MKKLLLSALIFCCIAVGCTKTDVPAAPEESISPIVKTDLPTSVNSLDPLQFNVYHIVFNGCGRFQRADTRVNGKTVTVRFLAVYADQMCTMDIPTRITPYTFIPKEKGTYTFRFRSGNPQKEEYIEEQLEVR
ncbi:hypothetical protein [Pedobacter sp. SYP-B3415]|uniref:hypothetical protein n=1 Tax=Pedobacter sp. SYP-B3415 TaxID=2496641 RepID=UPI00101C3CB2|nr:hypothetical protein [Pedobacter sp. SYP-B3415]